MNKKGFIGSTAVDVIAYIAFIVIVILFFIVFKIGATEKIVIKIDAEEQETNRELILLNILRSDIIVDNTRIKMSDLIIAWYNERTTYEPILKEEMQKILDEMSYEFKVDKVKKKSYALRIVDDKPIDFASKSWKNFHAKNVDVYLPVNDKKYLQIILYSEEYP